MRRESNSPHGHFLTITPRLEPFFKSLKAEEIRRKIYETHEQGVRTVADYFERLYSPERLHSTLKNVAPVKSENSLEHQAA